MSGPRWIAVLLTLGGYCVLLVTVPYTEPWPVDGVSAAAAEGYRTDLAFLVAVGWSVLVIGLLAAAGRRGAVDSGVELAAAPTPPLPLPRVLLECVIVGLAFAALYFPPALARYGPYVEDQYFLSLLQRMGCGQVPYRDFEFLYGPLMIMPAGALGFSMGSYFSYLSALVALQFGVVWGLLRFTTNTLKRCLIGLVLLTPLLIDVLLGFNWNGVRRTLPLVTIVLVSAKPRDWRVVTGTGVLLGIALAYSHDYALLGIAAVCGLYGFMLIRDWRLAWLLRPIALSAVAVVVWAAVSALLMGPEFVAYIRTVAFLTGQWSSGLGGFTFYWTVNSLAGFALLALTCVAVGPALLRDRKALLSAGDRLLLVSLIYGLLSLRSGLHRSDVWHIDAAFLALVLAWTSTWQRRFFHVGRRAQQAAMASIAILALTALIGMAPFGAHLARGAVRGWIDLAAGRPAAADSDAGFRTASILSERTAPDPQHVAIGNWLADPAVAARPVFFYFEAWGLPIHTGVCREDYFVDDFLFPQPRHSAASFIRENPDVLVVMSQTSWKRLAATGDLDPRRREWWDTPMKRVGARLGSVHFEAVKTELPDKEAFWRRTVGSEIIGRRFIPVFDTDDWIVLSGSEVSLDRGSESRP